MRRTRNMLKRLGAGGKRMVQCILEKPDIYEAPVRSRSVAELGFEDEVELLAALGDQSTRPELVEHIRAAHEGINTRVAHRDRSYNVSLLLAGLLATAQVSIMVAGLSAQDTFVRLATIPNDVGLLAVAWGVLAMLAGIFPTHRDDESYEALGRREFDWYWEDVTRSGKQRSQLWRLRVGLAIGLTLTMLTVPMVIVGLIV